MVKKHYALAIVSFLLIPAITVLAGVVFSSINPEIAAGHPNYERNYRLLDLARTISFVAALLLNMGLWFLTCFFLLKSKRQSYGWLPLAVIGPCGFIVLTMLKDNVPVLGDVHYWFLRKLNIYLRIAYELCLFYFVWVVAYQSMVLKRDLMILYESATTGVSTALIINQQNASSGMWAFSEGLEVMYLVVLFYLLWPICFDRVARLLKSYGPNPFKRRPDRRNDG